MGWSEGRMGRYSDGQAAKKAAETRVAAVRAAAGEDPQTHTYFRVLVEGRYAYPGSKDKQVAAGTALRRAIERAIDDPLTAARMGLGDDETDRVELSMVVLRQEGSPEAMNQPFGAGQAAASVQVSMPDGSGSAPNAGSAS